MMAGWKTIGPRWPWIADLNFLEDPSQMSFVAFREEFTRISWCPYNAISPHSLIPCLLTDQNFANNFWKGSPKEHSCENKCYWDLLADNLVVPENKSYSDLLADNLVVPHVVPHEVHTSVVREASVQCILVPVHASDGQGTLPSGLQGQ